MIRCLPPRELEGLFSRRMGPLEEEAWEAHFAECPRCSQMFAECTAIPNADQWRLAALELTEPLQSDFAFLEGLKSAALEANGVEGRAGTAIDYGNWFRGDSIDGIPSPESDRSAARNLPVHGQLPNVPGFEILGELGRGGMGVVYHARQIAQNRPVALKMILAGHQASAEDLGRFHDEAEAISRLRHPHIVQIFEVGQFDHRLYFVLEFVEGGTLADKIMGKPLPARSSAQLVESLARAMHYAHLRGIVHRDLKPANVLLHGRKAFLDIPEDADRLPEDWDFRRYMPKITDFGLAKLLDRSNRGGRTASGDVVGTPNYMAPEQAQGKPHTIGPTTDVYSLGALLYEMLTGRPPFQGATPMDTLLQVHSQDPIPPRKIVRDIPASLEIICLKCLRKKPSQRYPSAERLAEDLRLFLDGLPIQTRSFHPVWRGWNGLQQRVGNWTLASLLFGVSVVAGGALIALWLRESALGALESEHGMHAALALENADLRLRLAQAYCEQGDIARGMFEYVALLDRTRLEPNESSLGETARWNLANWLHELPVLLSIDQQPGRPVAVVKRPNGLELVALGPDAKPRPLSELRDAKPFSRDRNAHGELMAASPDGSWLAVWTGSAINWWNMASDRLVASRELSDLANCEGIDLSPDGSSLLVRPAGSDASLQLLTRGSGDTQAAVESCHDAKDIVATAWHPLGRSALVGRSDGSVMLADVKPWRVRQTRKFPAGIKSFAWLPGDIVAIGCADGQIRFWNTANPAGLEPAPIRAHQAGDVVVACGSSGILVSGGADRCAKLWNVAAGTLIASLPHASAVQEVAFTGDGTTFMTRDAAGSIRLWRLPDHAGFAIFPFAGLAATKPAVSANGQTILASLKNHEVVAWRQAGDTWTSFRMRKDTIADCSFAVPSPDGRTIATASTKGSNGIVEFWGLDQQSRARSLRLESPVTALVFQSDARRLLIGTGSGSVQVWNLGTAELETTMAQSGPVRCAAFGPENRAVIVGGESDGRGGEARIWSLGAPNQPLSPPLRHPRPIVEVAWEPDGRTIRTLDVEHVSRRWDLTSGQQLGSPPPFTADDRVVAFNPSGNRCLARGRYDALNLLTPDNRVVRLAVASNAEWKCAKFSANGRWLLTGFADGVQLWDAANGRAIGPRLRLSNLTGAEFLSDGKTILGWSATEAKRWTILAAESGDADDWREQLRRRTGMEWSSDGAARFLDAAEWNRAGNQ